jgi:hypothetical protein
MIKNKRNALEVTMLERRIQFIKDTDHLPSDPVEIGKFPNLLPLADVSSRQLLIQELKEIDQ